MKKIIAFLLLHTPLAHAQDKNSIKPLEGTWELNGTSLIGLRADEFVNPIDVPQPPSGQE